MAPVGDQGFDTIIGQNVKLKGNLKNKGSIYVHGRVEGEVASEETINVGETAEIKGPVKAKNVDVSGTVKGSVVAIEKLELNSKGQIFGDLTAKTLIIKPGAIFVGRSLMPEELSKTAKNQIRAELEEATPA